MTVVRAAVTQVAWTGDKESMIAVHEEYARQAADQGAGVICFQELFYPRQTLNDIACFNRKLIFIRCVIIIYNFQ